MAILAEGQLKREGRVADIVREYNCDLEQAFLRIVGHLPPGRVPFETPGQSQAA